MKPVLSIIIPCYNVANTLHETLSSVFAQGYDNWEAIIVNDGSTDNTAEIAKKWISKDERFVYYEKINEGLGKTRNFGIKRARGIFILPLDADNLIMPQFATEAVNILKGDINVGVVHGDAEYIGEKSGLWKIPGFKIENMLLDNYIDACAIYRKNLWLEVGGYDENLPSMGLEDWELWLAFGAINVNFLHLQKITFRYRVSKNSMINVLSNNNAEVTKEYIAKKHSSLYRFHYCKYVRENINLSSKLTDKRFVLNTFLKLFFGFSISKSNR